MPVNEVTQEVLDDFVSAAVAARDNATPEMLDQLAKQVGDIAQIALKIEKPRAFAARGFFMAEASWLPDCIRRCGDFTPTGRITAERVFAIS